MTNIKYLSHSHIQILSTLQNGNVKSRKYNHNGLNQMGLVAMKTLVTLAVSAAFCMETMTSYHAIFSVEG
jgi:hypothetical protein